jgi:hypothetical protein
MNQEVTRQILWNIPTIFVVFLYGMLIPLTAAFVWVDLKWYRTVRPVRRSPRVAWISRRGALACRLPTAWYWCESGSEVKGKFL